MKKFIKNDITKDQPGKGISSRRKDLEKINLRYEAIVVGVSAGGMEALCTILPSLPANFSCPVIIVQHMHPESGGYLPTILNKKCQTTVKEADEKEQIGPGVIYIAPPNYHLLIEKDRTFSLSLEEPVNFSRPSIDVLFESAADAYRERLVGVILTGANKDGSRGLKRIKEMGGLAIVQDPLTAEIDSMPRAAISAVNVDYVLPLDQIGPFLVKIGI